MDEIGPDFFSRPPEVCARELVGCLFRWDGCLARVVETEAYASVDDEACHTWNRKGAREFVEAHSAGTAYVYLNYGVHWLFNVLVKHPDASGFVLLRALEPVSGIEQMRSRRPGIADRQLCAGPGKLTKALGMSGKIHGQNFLQTTTRGFVRKSGTEVAMGPRIGISKAIDRLWRFGDPSSASLSQKF